MQFGYYHGRRTEGCRVRQGQCLFTALISVGRYHPQIDL